MIIKSIAGHSGCQVLLCEDGDKKFIRKISPSGEYNLRLMGQAEKQGKFKNEVIRRPVVYCDGFLQGRYYVDMEYIKGVSLHSFISLNTINNVTPVINSLCAYLGNIKKCDSVLDLTTPIEEKISLLRPPCGDKYSSFLDYCLSYPWNRVLSSSNHGDLTFENIIISKGTIYFIDFLDSKINTKYVDYAKLMLDALIGWSWRIKDDTPLIKVMRVYNILVESLDHESLELCKRLLVLNLMRIVPYSNKESMSFLEPRIRHIGEIYHI